MVVVAAAWHRTNQAAASLAHRSWAAAVVAYHILVVAVLASYHTAAESRADAVYPYFLHKMADCDLCMKKKMTHSD